MGLFETRSRRAALVIMRDSRDMIPAGFEAVADALRAGHGSTDACLVIGRQLADDGTSLEQALSGLRITTRAILGRDPAFADVEALCLAWSEATLGYLHQLSCEDPMTGLASLAHLRSRLSELYRGELRRTDPTSSSADSIGPRPVQDTHALIVLDLPSPATMDRDGVTRALQLAQLGVAARTVFPGSEIAGRLGLRRVGVLAARDAALGRRVSLLRVLTSEVDRSGRATRVWIEGLPKTDSGAAQLLDELART